MRHWALSADVESVAWNPHDANYFAASSEDGVVKYFDARVDKKPVFTLQAHDGALGLGLALTLNLTLTLTLTLTLP